MLQVGRTVALHTSGSHIFSGPPSTWVHKLIPSAPCPILHSCGVRNPMTVTTAARRHHLWYFLHAMDGLYEVRPVAQCLVYSLQSLISGECARKGPPHLKGLYSPLWEPMIHTRVHSKGFWWWCIKKTPWPESASELYRPRERRLSVKLVQTSADRR
jgi:hypothetical protein